MSNTSHSLDTGTFTGWVAALEALEAEIVWAEELSQNTTGTWSAPAGLGPLPPELVERARNILAAQRSAHDRLEAARIETGRHLAALSVVPAARDRSTSVYLDVQG